ncbi:MAG TPA: hypothetical protein VHK69_21580, partial [Chitinophagaceae bacterium]|nr:hypothetical protein [Chitinophagaceae bacterium]
MKRILCCLLLLAGALGPKAQVMVEFRLETPARTNDTGAVYIAGSFNGWNPQSEKGRLQRDAPGRYSLRLSLPAGAHEYKFTRGGWNRGEAGPGGKPAPNRQLLLARDTVVGIQIEHWADG